MPIDSRTMTHTAILGTTCIDGYWKRHILAVVENEKLPEALKKIVEIFYPVFLDKMENPASRLTLEQMKQSRLNVEPLRKAWEEEDWKGVIDIYMKTDCGKTHTFHFSPMQISTEDEDVVKSVVVAAWAAKSYGMKEGPDKQAIQSAMDEDRWSDAQALLSRLNKDNA